MCFWMCDHSVGLKWLAFKIYKTLTIFERKAYVYWMAEASLSHNKNWDNAIIGPSSYL